MRANLYHVLLTDSQRSCLPLTQANTHNIYGQVISGNTADGYDVCLDILSPAENVILKYTCNKLTVVSEGEEEIDYDHPP